MRVRAWAVEALTGEVAGELRLGEGSDFSTRLDGGECNAIVMVGHLLTRDGSEMDTAAVERVVSWTEPGEYSIAITDDSLRLLGEWWIAARDDESYAGTLEVSGSGWETYPDEVLLPSDLNVTNDQLSIARDLLLSAFNADGQDLQIDVPAATSGVVRSMQHDAWSTSIGDLLRILGTAENGFEWAVSATPVWSADGQSLARVERAVQLGHPVLAHEGGMTLTVAPPGSRAGMVSHLSLGVDHQRWASRIAGLGAERIAEQATAVRPANRLAVERVKLYTSIKSAAEVARLAAGARDAAQQREVPVELTVLVDRIPAWPAMGDVVRVVAEWTPTLPSGWDETQRVGEVSFSVAAGEVVEAVIAVADPEERFPFSETIRSNAAGAKSAMGGFASVPPIASGLPGPPGVQGIPGAAGTDGRDGVDGKDGVNGVNGERGIDGTDGKDGAQGVPGPQGPAGLKGDQGEPGPAGGPEGPEGPKGDKGEQGPAGPQGIQGGKGDRGDAGPKGDRGDAGPAGLRGPDGPQGLKGDPGAKGDKGDKGDPGIQGPAGAKGDKGDAGPSGSGIDSEARRMAEEASRDAREAKEQAEEIERTVIDVKETADDAVNRAKEAREDIDAIDREFDPDVIGSWAQRQTAGEADRKSIWDLVNPLNVWKIGIDPVISGFESWRTGATSQLSALTNPTTGAGARIGALETWRTGAQSQLSGLTNPTTGAGARLGALEGWRSVAGEQLSGLTNPTTGAGARLGSLENWKIGVGIDLASAGSRLGTLEGQMGVLTNPNSGAGARLGRLESDMASAGSRLGSLEGSRTTQGNRITNLERDMGGANTRFIWLENRVPNNLPQTLSNMGSSISTIAGNLQDLAGRVAAIEKRLSM